jgi:CarD family transcriptional regulator
MCFGVIESYGEKMSDYQVGDYLMHESSGVCQVAEISEKALQGKGSEKMYYSLDPVFQSGSQVITPVASKVRIRDVKSKEEMQNLLDKVLELPVIREQNIRALGDIFKEKMSEFDPVPLATVVKTVYLREQIRMAAGKKAMSSDEKVMATAGRKLFEEMAFALGEDMDTVRTRFFKNLKTEKDLCIKTLEIQ